jgi:hypothetical protein
LSTSAVDPDNDDLVYRCALLNDNVVAATVTVVIIVAALRVAVGFAVPF